MEKKIIYLLITAIIIICIALVAVYAINQKSPAVKAPLAFNSSNDNTTVSVNKGENFTLTLDENPTTGYTWNLTLTKGLHIVNDTYVTDSSAIGSGDSHTWLMNATNSGTYSINAINKRPWDPVYGNETKYVLTINVT
jgi:inhibitor of cysteine peptidase